MNRGQALMTQRASVFFATILVAGCAGLTTAAAVPGTDRGHMAMEEPEIGAFTVSAATSVVAGMDGQSPGSRNERIELADGQSRFSGGSLRKKDAPVAAEGDKTNPSPDTSVDLRKKKASPSRFSGGSLRKKDAPVAAEGDKTNPSPDTSVDLRKKKASPSRSSGSEAPERSDGTAAAPDVTKEQAAGTDGECTTNSADTQGGEAADAVKKAGKKAVVGKAPKKKLKLGKKRKCKKTKSAPKKKQSKPLSSRDAEKKAQDGLKQVQGQTQSGLKEVVGNANRAAQAADKLAPEVKPSAVSEDHLDLGNSDDLGE